jgi:hypothetical protein
MQMNPNDFNRNTPFSPQPPASGSEPPTLNHSGSAIPINPSQNTMMPHEERVIQPVPPQPQSQPQNIQPPVVTQPVSAPQFDATQPQLTTQQRQEYSIDYLNEIAPKQQKTVNKFAVFGLIGGVLLAVVAAVFMLSSSGGPDIKTQAKDIQGRIATLQAVTDAQQTHLKEPALSEANATLSTTLSSMNTEFTTLLKTRKIVISKAVLPAEKTYAETLTKKLDDSYQRGTLDRNYPTQMTYELTLLRSKIKKLRVAASSKTVSAFCDTATTNIDIILAAYTKYNATTQ